MARRPNPTLRAKRKENLMQSIIKIINEESISEATTRHISEMSNLTIASLHYYFGSKDGALVATGEGILDEWISEILKKKTITAEEKIRRIFTPPKYMIAFSQILTHPYRQKSVSRKAKFLDMNFTNVIKEFLKIHEIGLDDIERSSELIKTFLIGLSFKIIVNPDILDTELANLKNFFNKKEELPDIKGF
ncbi:transcriptional regulator, TetR family [Marinitoga hydrogenitolerans DSM 16785]|uniref:Transcriptional regulator, TetR family n=1 Tax=Marinitoga hydrogenitolerans (strain DSM 16785 / JCM 12826 / AT1271) TaxID=1122195 RepID=A0A1M4XVZ7_MARH1|nr:TetR/AcrR family transcriptional regulator [Marinitoga hydrogenitolerans]SHE97432.1 transcriptional regulator, TetR family [Marinitoga hydrogenitolerans DSM 16785]